MSGPGAPFHLALPDELHLAPAALARLERTLAADPDLAGAVALVEDLPPGSSAAVHAERRAATRAATTPLRPSDRAVRGAALLRDPSALVEVLAATIVPGPARLVVDGGAVAHDPWAATTAPAASPVGRPPYPRRPVVVFLATEPDIGAADTARALVNGLLRRGVEGRLAVPDVPSGLHLARPCSPEAATIAALEPDVVVALDPDAIDRAADWCRDLRSTVLVELTAEVTDEIDLVPWTIDHLGSQGEGRLRARIGRLTSVDALAALVNRLCSGPLPAPPADPDPEHPRPAPVALRRGAAADAPTDAHRTAAAALGAVVVVGATEPAGHAPLDTLTAHLVAAGADVGSATERTQRHAATDADLLLVGAPAPRWLGPVLDTRRTRGRVSVVVAAPALLRGPETDLAALATLARRAGAAVVPSPGVALDVEGDVRVHCMRPLVSPVDIERLAAAGATRPEAASPLLGWVIGAEGAPAPAHLGAVAAAIGRLLATHPDLGLEVLDRSSVLARDLRDHPQVSVLDALPGPARLAGWSAVVWSPEARDLTATGDVDAVVRASLAGVPTVLGADDAAVVGGFADPSLVVHDQRAAEAWNAVLAPLVATPTGRAAASTAASTTGLALAGPDAAVQSLLRTAGWIRRLSRGVPA